MPNKHQRNARAGTVRTRGAATSPQAKRDLATKRGRQDEQRTLIEAACHALRQPLQSLVLLQALLARTVDGVKPKDFVARLDDALHVMTAIVEGLTETPPHTSASTVQGPLRGHIRKDASAQHHLTPAVFKTAPARTTVYVVDDDASVRQAIADVLELDGHVVQPFPSCEAFLAHAASTADGCLLVDAYLPEMSGLDLLLKIQADGFAMPAIMITGNSDVPMAVQAMKAGAVDFIEKPFRHIELLACIDRAMEQSRDQQQLVGWRRNAATQLSALTVRQREIMEMVLAGKPSKIIAADLGISQRTVENHRASIMKRTGATSLPALARLAAAATSAVPETSA